jgi:probable selenium-dependent hydroxylase accessory protein YqeC
MGLSALGRPVSGLTVHRLEEFLKVTGSNTGDLLTPELLLRLISRPGGSFRGVPAGVRRLLFLNQADTEDDVREGESLARAVLDRVPGVECVAVTSFSQDNRIAGRSPIRSIITI